MSYKIDANGYLFSDITLSWEEEIISKKLTCFSFWEEGNLSCTSCKVEKVCKATFFKNLYQYCLERENQEFSIVDILEKIPQNSVIKIKNILNKAYTAFDIKPTLFICGFCKESIQDKALWYPKYGLAHELCYNKNKKAEK